MLFAVLSCCALVHASPALRPPFFDLPRPNELGIRKIPLSSHRTESFRRQPKLGPNAKQLWNISANDVGKLSSIALNAEQKTLVTGTTFTPLNQVTTIDLATGKILSKSAPGDQFTYSTALSKDASRTAAYGCPVQPGDPCTLAVWQGTDTTKTPAWTKDIPGVVLWGARGMRMSTDGSIVAASALEQDAVTDGDFFWFDGKDGTQIGQLHMNYSIGEVFANAQYVATREFINTGGPYLQGYVRIIPLSSSEKNCSVRADYNSLDLSASLKTVAQPASNGSQVYAHWSDGAGSCGEIGRWAVPPTQAFAGLATSDYGTIVATFIVATRTFTFYSFVGLHPVAKPTVFSLQMPEEDFEAEDLHMTFAPDGIHLALDIASLGTYYVDLSASPPQPQHVFTTDNPCGVLSLAIDIDQKSGSTYIVAAYNQLISEQPGMLECMLGNNGLTAFQL